VRERPFQPLLTLAQMPAQVPEDDECAGQLQDTFHVGVGHSAERRPEVRMLGLEAPEAIINAVA